MKIGIFDSGIGGISVLHEAYHRLPNEEYIFYADVDHVPYGIKSSEEIKGFVDEIVGKLYGMGVDAIVIACNTATAVGAAYVREKYDIPIIGMEPAVKPAIEVAERTSGRVLVMATPVTIRENKLHDLLVRLDTDHKVDLLPMPGLVRMAESEIFEGADVDDYIEEQLAVFDKEKYSEVVLGCTHFNYFKPAISKAFHGKVQLIDAGNAPAHVQLHIHGLNLFVFLFQLFQFLVQFLYRHFHIRLHDEHPSFGKKIRNYVITNIYGFQASGCISDELKKGM